MIAVCSSATHQRLTLIVGVDYWMREQIIAGDPDYALERILQMTEETGQVRNAGDDGIRLG